MLFFFVSVYPSVSMIVNFPFLGIVLLRFLLFVMRFLDQRCSQKRTVRFKTFPFCFFPIMVRAS